MQKPMRLLFDSAPEWQNSLWLIALLTLTIASNALVSTGFPGFIRPVHFDGLADGLGAAALILLALPLFLLARFSFGYFVGVFVYLMVAGFVVISYSTPLHHDHALARFSAVASLIAFLIPALFLRPQWRWSGLSASTLQALLYGILLFAVVILVVDISYGFRLAGFYQSQQMRDEVARPALLNYAGNMLSCAALPFTLAWFASRRRWGMALLTTLLMLSFFPVMLNKLVVFSPFWTLALLLLFGRVEARRATVLALLIPMAGAGITYLIDPVAGFHLLGIVSLRMFATPSIVLDQYFAFFADHPLTHFCQINIVRAFTGCPYTQPIGVMLKDVYNQGNLNGSMFATEGVASVGPFLAPLVMFGGGIVIAMGNVVSSRLPPALVAASSGTFLIALMNVPLSTSMLTNGGLLLFLLWSLSSGRADQAETADIGWRHVLRGTAE